jgi:hypothetical protein
MAAGRVIQNLLIAAGVCGSSRGWLVFGGHAQFISLHQFLWQQSVKLIFQPQGSLST